MNILVLSINYSPEATGFAPHTAALCEHLAATGHRVSVVTGFPFAPYWRRLPEYRRKFSQRESLKGVEVARVTHFIPRRAGQFFQRLLMEGTFCLTAALTLLTSSREHLDVVVYVGAQPSIAMLARLISTLKRVPYLVKITDLAAQAAVDVGIIKSGPLRNILEKFEFVAYRRAAGASVLCRGFQDVLVNKGYPANRIRVIYNSEDLKLIRPVDSGGAFRQKHGIAPDAFVVLYSGSFGIKQGMGNIVEAARLVRKTDPSLKWLLVGDGELRPLVEKLIVDDDLQQQVILLPLQEEAEMSSMFSAADVLLLNQLTEVKDSVIPGKLLTYMAAGRPVVAAINSTSQAAAMIREAEGGMLVTPEDPVALAEAVKQLADDRNKLAPMGRRNRLYAEQHFDRTRIMADQEEFLLAVVNEKTAQTGLA